MMTMSKLMEALAPHVANGITVDTGDIEFGNVEIACGKKWATLSVADDDERVEVFFGGDVDKENMIVAIENIDRIVSWVLA